MNEIIVYLVIVAAGTLLLIALDKFVTRTFRSRNKSGKKNKKRKKPTQYVEESAKQKFVKKENIAPVLSLVPSEDNKDADLLSALQNMGYTKKVAKEAAQVVLRDSPSAPLEQLVRKAIKHLNGAH